MAEVKRYDLIVEPFSWADETKVDDYNPALREATAGLVVCSSDHDRIVSRLQRERARNLVRALHWQCCYLMAGWGESDVTHRKLRLADRIAAKYLGEKS